MAPLGKIENLINCVKVKEDAEEQLAVISSEGEVCHELAPYVEGDSLKLMHWKLLARREIYMVRQREDHAVVKKEYLFILDPIYQEQEGENRAKLIDKLLVACVSLAYAFLKQGEKVTLVYKKEAVWQQLTLSEVVAVEQLATVLSEYTGDMMQEGEERWPYSYLSQHYSEGVSKILLTTHLNKHLSEVLEEEKFLNVLEMKRGPWAGESLISAWYLSEAFEVSRYV